MTLVYGTESLALAFNSLFEMPKREGGLAHARLGIRPFNSLFEMLALLSVNGACQGAQCFQFSI